MFRRQVKNVKFFSLRWTVIIFLSLILLLVNSALAYLNYTQSSRQYATELENVRSIQSRQIKALLKNGYTVLSQISSLIPLIADSGGNRSFEQNFHEMLEKAGTLLDIEWGIQSLYLFSTQKELQLSWPGIPGLETAFPTNLVLHKTQMSSDLFCSPDCQQFVASPILERGETTGYIALSRSIASPIVTFNQLTDSDVIILSSDRDELKSEQSSLRYLQYWDKYLSAITNPEKSYLIIKLLEKRMSIDDLSKQPYQLNIEDDWYELHRADLGTEDVYFFIINNITENKKQVSEAAKNSILIGFSGLILTEVLLIFMLRSPVSRLTNLAANLPLLVEGQYQQLRDKLLHDRRPKQIINEIDITLDATRELADRLETLQVSRQKAEQDLTWLADHDTLTELFNRRRFQLDFKAIIKQCKRYNHQGALLFIDMDAFKEINDLSGHLAGDRLLQKLAGTMRKLVRSTDLLARLGGDEFAVVIPEATEHQAIEFADKICRKVSQVYITEMSFTHYASVSIGVALFPVHGKTVPELMANADLAMYHSKNTHPGHSHLFSLDEQAREKLNQRLTVKELIIDALENNLFELQYQPIVEVASGHRKYYEALIRIRNNEGELIYPDAFIPVAEQTGLIRKIDQWVIHESTRLLSINPELALSINLSSHALIDDAVVETLAANINQSNIDPQRLLLEVTESGVIHNINTAVNVMQKIRTVGCKFALDDFGTGFASYNHLKMLPVDIIKIDGCFIKNIESSKEDRLFVKSITEIGGSMDMQIVAEYVENKAIFNILSELGVQYAQGYHLGKPAELP